MRKQNAEKKWTQKSKIDHNPSEVTTHSRDKTKSNKVADGKDRSIVTGCKSNSLGLSANAPLFPDTTMVLTGESGGRPEWVAECEKDRDTKDKTYNDNPSEVTTHSGDKTRSNKVADGKDRSKVTGCKSNSLGLSANAPLFRTLQWC